MARSIDTNFRTDADNLKWLLAILENYGMFNKDIAAISTIGFNAHVLNDMNENTAYIARRAKRESFVVTAQDMDSLYKHASEVEIYPEFAKPASLSLVLSIDEELFEKYSTPSGTNVRTYTIKKESFISVGNYIYSLDYDILIRLEYGLNNDRYITARYVVGNVKNPISNLENYNIKIIRAASATGGWVYQLYLNLQQYVREIVTREFGDRDNAIFAMSTKRPFDQIADIQIFRIPLGLDSATGPVELKKKFSFENSRTSEDSIFIKYDSFNRFTLIHKSQEGGFRPAVSDKIQTILYTTSGEEANFTFTSLGGEHIKFNSKEDSMLRPQIDLISSGSFGGVSFSDSKEMLRKRIITKRGTRNSILTENDLLLLLNVLNLPNTYYVIKNRNDIQKVFNIFTNLTFSNNGLTFSIPTNTLHIDWNYRNNKYGKDLGDMVWQMESEHVTSRVVNKGELMTEAEIKALGPNDLKYSLPFILTYNRERNIVRMYSEYIDGKYFTENEVNNTQLPYTYICNWVQFSKQERSDELSMEFHLRTNIAGVIPKEKFFRIVNEHTLEIESTGYLNAIVSFTDKNGNEVFKQEATLTRYTLDEDNQDDFFTYKIKLIDEGKENMLVKNDTIRINKPGHPGDYIWVPISDLEGKIEIFTPTKRSPGSEVLDIDRGKVNTFKFKFDLLKNESVNYKVQHSVLDNDSIRIFFVPLVGYDFYKDHKGIFRKSIIEKDFLDDYLSSFQGEFSYSLKYVNTYGLSELYKVGIKEPTPLSSIQLNMSFIIELNLGSTLTENELSLATARYIESIRMLDGEDFHVSKLYDFLYSLYPQDINLIQFVSINNLKSDKQLIKVDTSKINNKITVEKLTLPIEYNNLTKSFNYKIQWDIIKSNL